MAVMISPHGCFQIVPWLNADAGGCVVRSALGAGHQRWAKSTSQVFTCHNTTQTRTKEREGATRLGKRRVKRFRIPIGGRREVPNFIRDARSRLTPT